MLEYSRRRFLALSASGAGLGALGALGTGCRDASAPVDAGTSPPIAAAPDELRAIVAPTDLALAEEPPPEPPIRSRGREDVVLMAGTEWEAHGTIFHSGLLGPRFMVLGGVHGNEPGGWLGAEEVANWGVRRGVLLVLPRINWRSAAAFERTLAGFGDLNRLYPGHPDGLPMARMAAEVTTLADYWRPHWLWDMHESWAFFNERGENSGTAFIGQTVTSADPDSAEVIERMITRVNAQVAEREQFLTRMRLGGVFRNDGVSPTPRPDDPDRILPDGTRGSSSLSLGRFVPGVQPVLVEMGQANQSEARRAELHQLLVRDMLTDLRML